MLKGGEDVVQGTHVRELTPEWVARAVGGRLHPGGGPVRDLVWHSGAATSVRRIVCLFFQPPPPRTDAIGLRWPHTTPFGRPVEPLV